MGEMLAPLVQRFARQGVLGVVLVDATFLSLLERHVGHAPCAQAMATLAGLVRDVVDDALGGEEIVVTGETGRYEIVTFVFRSLDEGRFYRSELPGLSRTLQEALERQGQRLVYPFSRTAPVLGVGYAGVIRNPFLGSETQLREALEEARRDARLVAGLEERRRRKSFAGIVLAGDVTSVYEPIVDVVTKTVFGYEALARGPVGTAFHSPAALFEAAEAEGLIFELDCLCRRSGLDGAVGLPSGTRLFLNVRPTTIHDPSFRPDALIRTLERTKLQPSDVVFEISEQESIESFTVFREIRDDYKNLGFQFALDDTGAGYASLQAVIELEPDFIKVDRALIAGLDTDPGRQSLLRALQGVAGGIGARIIAEGLDTLGELEMLGELGIPFGQGWLFGKPTPLRAHE
jgi:EAL domain-containing protein (putative c-di-GMP-specific phosphodiesterase class I)